jgi:hypothetical protein
MESKSKRSLLLEDRTTPSPSQYTRPKNRTPQNKPISYKIPPRHHERTTSSPPTLPSLLPEQSTQYHNHFHINSNAQNSSIQENPSDQNIILLNVGGHRYITSYSTLCARGPHFLSTLVSHDVEGKIPAKRDKDGYIWIDRNGRIFEVVLEYLRTGHLFVPGDLSYDQVEAELDFYQIKIDVNQRDPEITAFYSLVDKQASKIRESVSKWLEDNQSKIFGVMKREVKEDSPKTDVTLHFHLDYSRTSQSGTPWVCDTRVSLILPPDYVSQEPTAAINSAWMRMLCHLMFKNWKIHCRFFCSGKPPKLQLILDWSPLICPSILTDDESYRLLQSLYVETSAGPAIRAVNLPHRF